jgi:hypothetical protein
LGFKQNDDLNHGRAVNLSSLTLIVGLTMKSGILQAEEVIPGWTIPVAKGF